MMPPVSKEDIISFRKSFESLNGHILLTDPEGIILYINRAIETEKQFSPKEIVGKPLEKIWCQSLSKSFYQTLWQTIQVKKQPFSENFHISPILNHLGEVEYYLEVEPKFNSFKEEQEFEREFMTTMSDSGKIETPGGVLEKLWLWTANRQVIPYKDQKKITLLSQAHQELPALLEKTFLSHSDFNMIQDRQWTKEARECPEMFEKLYRKYKTAIFNYFFYRLGKNTGSTEDFTQETFLRAFTALERFEFKNCSYLSYLRRVAHNLLVNHYRSKKTISLENLPEIIKIEKEDISKGADLSFLWAKVKNLSKKHQKVLKMKYKKDMPVREIAKKLNKTENAIKLILSRARKKLRAEMNNPQKKLEDQDF